MDNMQKVTVLLNDEVQEEIEILKKIEPGSEKYKNVVDGTIKMVDRIVEIHKIREDQEFREKQYKSENKMKYEQMKKDQIDRYVKNCLTAAGIIIPVMLGAWGTLAHFEFEKNGGTTSTFIGREYIKKLLPNIVLK